ncbi:MAG TPA: ABC transporter permease [Candidatus Faecaligallichristensenella faecipullorum]|nr:ABC transporter permease [Candidatus Faecaligallichristensenella faecipullorum]
MLIFLYAPIVVMIVYSFNASKTRARWGGFSLRWYEELFRSRQIMDALSTTVSIAVFAALVATVLGTLAAIGIHAMKSKPAKVLINISYLPMTMPDIVTGVSLMLLFVFSRFPLGYWSMLMAHITFDTPYVLFSVLPKLKQMNVNLYEAALDLGCTPMQAVRKVILPQIMPGVFTGALLAFTMSLDDFVISYFTTATESNLSILVYSMARRGIKPTINALSALMFVVVLVLLLLINRRSKLENV